MLPSNSTTESLFPLSAAIDFIDLWMQGLEQNSLERSNMYFETMKNMFQKIPVELPKPLSHKIKLQYSLHAIGGDWYMNKFNENITPLNKRILRKNYKKRRMKEKEICRYQIKIGTTGNFRYTVINLSG